MFPSGRYICYHKYRKLAFYLWIFFFLFYFFFYKKTYSIKCLKLR